MTSKHVVYVGPFSFPEGGAAAKRIYYICKSCLDLGMNVTVASGQTVKDDEVSERDYNGIKVISLNERTSEHLPKTLKHLRYFNMGKKTIAWLDSLESKPDTVILYSGYSPYLIKLIQWGKKNQVKILFDAVEWYDPPSMLSTFAPYYLNIELAMRFLIPKVDGVIAISSFLTDYYKRKKCQVVKVPPTVDIRTFIDQYTYCTNELSLVYAGSPGHKDLLYKVILAVEKVNQKGIPVSLNVVGLNTTSLEHYCAKYNVNKSALEYCIAHGYLPYEDTNRLVSTSDFSILIRPLKRYAQAGFSTKFVESLSSGTPVIANLTSDIGDYLKNGINGVVSQGYNIESIEDAIEQAAEFKSMESRYKSCRLAAKESSKLFHYSEYNSFIKHFL